MEKLAIEGGRPVRKTLLPYGRHHIANEDVRAVTRTLGSEWITQGPKIQQFEEAFARYVGARFAVSFSSGTAALHAACHAAGIESGAEVITSPMTFVASANCILYENGRPVFADVDPVFGHLSVEKVVEQITDRTRAILPVHYSGNPCDIDALSKLAKSRGLTVIEDACHALGAEVRNRRIGSGANLTVFSLHPVKHITSGEGGMVTTNRVREHKRLLAFRNHGITKPGHNGSWYYEMRELGYNYRMTDISASLGLSQLGRADRELARRRSLVERYRRILSDIEQIEIPPERPGCSSAHHLFYVLLNFDRLTAGKARIFKSLRSENIGVQVHYIPVHLHPYYKERFGTKPGDFPEAERFYERELTLPLFPSMTRKDQDDVNLALRKVLGRFTRRK